MTCSFTWVDLILLQLIQMECSEHEAKGLMTSASLASKSVDEIKGTKEAVGDRGVNCVET